MYKLIVDHGKPSEEFVSDENELIKRLSEIYEDIKRDEDEGVFTDTDVFVFDGSGNDISESQFIEEMIADIMGEDYNKEITEILEKSKIKNIVYDEDIKKCCSRKEWDVLIKSLHHKNLKQEIHKSIYFYFLEVLPPIKYISGGFLFREGYGEIWKFTEENGKFFHINLGGGC